MGVVLEDVSMALKHVQQRGILRIQVQHLHVVGHLVVDLRQLSRKCSPLPQTTTTMLKNCALSRFSSIICYYTKRTINFLSILRSSSIMPSSPISKRFVYVDIYF